ncbi:MAG TPA: BON domain-containing protein, partial [Burkholderiales bacterium]|nr:BON domain-containing protein [Burkholderiales bacterium]
MPFVVALALAACGRDDPGTAQAPAQTPPEAAKQAERAAEAGKPLDDAGLAQIVRSALQSESTLNTQKIDIEVRQGNVALHGAV